MGLRHKSLLWRQGFTFPGGDYVFSTAKIFLLTKGGADAPEMKREMTIIEMLEQRPNEEQPEVKPMVIERGVRNDY